MRYALALLTLMLLMGCGSSQEEADEAEFEPLGRRFLAALQSERSEDAMACWYSVEGIEKLLKDPPEGMSLPPVAEHAGCIAYFEERDEVIGQLVPAIIKTLKEQGLPPAQLRYASSEAREVDDLGPGTVGWVTVVLRAPDGTTVEFGVDDAIKRDGEWHFLDKPSTTLTITRDGTETLVVAGQ
jgi:hypothetical protein